MKVVVVGATGNIGTAVVERLLADPEVTEVHGVARRLPVTDAARHPGGGRVLWHAADVRSDPLGPLVRGADCVVQLAWMFQPTHQPDVTWGANVLGTRRLLDAVVEEAVPHVVVSSSVAAYSPRRDDRPVAESWPTHGASAASYAREKAYVERLLDITEGMADGPLVTRVRPAFVFQRRAASEQWRIFASRAVPQLLVRRGLVPVLPFPDDVSFQAVHAADVADGIVRCVVRRPGGAVNLCAPDVVDPDTLAGLLGARRVHVPKRLVRGVVSAGWGAHLVGADPHLWDALTRLPVMSAERARTELGWQPEHSARDAVGELLTAISDGAGHGTAPLHPA